MPYSVPTPPKVNSPAKETPPTRSPIPHSKKGFCTPPTHVENIETSSSSGIHGPMPGIPRRASSRNTSPVMSRSASSTHQSFSTVRPTIDGLPRRGSHTTIPSTPTSGLPQHVGSLGLKLHPSPTTAPSMSRAPQDSLDSTSSLDSSLPPTPRDDPLELGTMSSATPAVEKSSVPFPEFESTPRASSSTHPLRNGTTSSRRPSLIRQHSASTSGHNRGGGSLQLQIAGSASTSELVPSPADYRPTRPTSMIRKKSGEVVKPSLKQRSMSTPDMTRLKEENEPDEEDAPSSRPFGGERSKSVRFADADPSVPGSALENTVLYVIGSRPISVSATMEGECLTETETEADTDASDFVHFRTRKNEQAKAHDDAREIALEGGSRIPRVRCDFAPHALDGEMVVMERADLTTVHGALCIQGTVIVRNVAFQKWVAVRFTMDHWQTTSEVSGNHVTHVPSSTTHDEGWDRFSFTIKLEDYKRKLEEKQLMICIRFSVEGREWWDSNNGLNYQFNFKRSSPRRSRHSLPPSKKIASDFAHEHSLPGLRQGGFTPSSRIAHQFGVGSPKPSSSDKARDWNFPVLGRGQGSGANSPALSPPPAAAYQAPPLPDVHTHLTLKNHCAPSPPKTSASLPPAASTSQAASEIVESAASTSASASTSTSKASPGHDRASSWAGKSESWDSFSKVLNEDSDNYASTDGSSTPLATGSGSASVEDMSSRASPPRRGLTMKRSTNDLQALRNGGGGLTPPSSHDSSPSPLQHTVALPQTTEAQGAPPMSPDPSDPSRDTTGDSSPLDTVPNDSTADLANLRISDPNTSSAHRLLNDASYQEFINKFCFFQSPNRVIEELPPVRKTYSHVSGHASPAGFPFYGHQGSSSQQSSTLSSSSSLSTGSASSSLSTSNNDNTTPRQEYDSATDAFSIPHRPESLTPRAMSRQNSD